MTLKLRVLKFQERRMAMAFAVACPHFVELDCAIPTLKVWFASYNHSVTKVKKARLEKVKLNI
jgi:hypothetical protein